jgi:hypothetical protein
LKFITFPYPQAGEIFGKADIMQVVPEINLNDLVQYCEQRNVSVVLWAGYAVIEKVMEGVCCNYSEIGIRGFMVEFMDCDYSEHTQMCLDMKALSEFSLFAIKPSCWMVK